VETNQRIFKGVEGLVGQKILRFERSYLRPSNHGMRDGRWNGLL
jgi:hypothetical protein